MAVTISGSTGIAGVDGSAGTPAVQGADTNTGMFFPAADTIAFAEGGVEAMRIDSSGNVGIGTSSPSDKLSVVTSAVNGGVTISGSTDPQYYLSSSGGNTARFKINDTSTMVQIGSWSNIATGFYTNGTEQARISSAGVFSFNSGYGSAAVAYGCRAWVSYNGTTPAVNASGNISSVTRNSTGDYTLNFTNAMPDTNYSMGGMIGDIAGGTVNARILASGITSAPTLMSTTQVRMATYVSNNIYTFNAFVIR